MPCLSPVYVENHILFKWKFRAHFFGCFNIYLNIFEIIDAPVRNTFQNMIPTKSCSKDSKLKNLARN